MFIRFSILADSRELYIFFTLKYYPHSLVCVAQLSVGCGFDSIRINICVMKIIYYVSVSKYIF